MIDLLEFSRIMIALDNHPEPLNGMPLHEHIEWSENAMPPPNAEEFALEAIFVICNSGMKHTVARGIFERIRSQTAETTFDAHRVFRHAGKAQAINEIWDRRRELFDAYLHADDKVEFCGSLPWIGNITKYHLAKNFGVDVAKPDVHLERLAKAHGTTPQSLCEHLASLTGYKARTIDLILWMACAKGIINSAQEAEKAAA